MEGGWGLLNALLIKKMSDIMAADPERYLFLSPKKFHQITDSQEILFKITCRLREAQQCVLGF